MKILLIFILLPMLSAAQLKWMNVDSLYQPLPKSVHVFFSNDSLDGKPNIAYYVEAEMKDKHVEFTADTTYHRRLTPQQFFEKNEHPLLVVNCTFFEFVHNSNLNLVMKNGKMLAFNTPVIGRGKDTFTYSHPFVSAIAISRKRKADVAWTYADSLNKKVYAMQFVAKAPRDSSKMMSLYRARQFVSLATNNTSALKKWKVRTAVGGGPVLMQDGEIKISNNEEQKFAGKAINDKHPRTGMGYTKNGKLIIMVIQGRFNGIAEGATLEQEARMLKELGCWEALNLDGGGSSCMLVNGKQTIKPSDKEGERPVPAVFIIRRAEK